MIFTVVNINLPFMTYASKTTFCLNNIKILRPKVTKNLILIKMCFIIYLKYLWPAQKSSNELMNLW